MHRFAIMPRVALSSCTMERCMFLQVTQGMLPKIKHQDTLINSAMAICSICKYTLTQKADVSLRFWAFGSAFNFKRKLAVAFKPYDAACPRLTYSKQIWQSFDAVPTLLVQGCKVVLATHPAHCLTGKKTSAKHHK